VDLQEVARVPPQLRALPVPVVIVLFVPAPEEFHGKGEALERKDEPGADEQPVPERACRVIPPPAHQTPHFADSHLPVIPPEVKRVEVLHRLYISIQDIARDKVRLAHLLVDVPIRGPRAYRLVVLLVQLAERGAVRQRVRLEELQPAVELLQSQLELALR